MGQAIGGVPGAAALSGPATRADEIGAYLARQRKLRGISLDELETLTHIPRRSLERLESGVYDGDPDGFVRGFVRTVSLAIGLDPEETVARMLEEPSAERPHQRISLPRVLLAAALGLGAALALALAPGVLRTHPAPPSPEPRASAPAPAVRWDAVRELSESLESAGAAAAATETAAGPALEPEEGPGPLPSADARDPHRGPGPSGG